MDLDGLLNNILSGSANIDIGRKNLAADGLEHAGRLFYEDGISVSMSAFQEAQTAEDPRALTLVELTFLQQEFQFCDEEDAITKSSLGQAIQSFEDALACLKIAEDASAYRSANATYPTSSKYRYQGFPRDAVHLACAAHRTRIQNSLRTPGINMIEKAVLTQRAANMTAIQGAYAEKQKAAIGE
ncbi:MAG: hypothetical protein LBD09_05755 [Treponema sp.]|jgi:hypothetical protein|nr:hypothetical protein [Treponema sp.]